MPYIYKQKVVNSLLTKPAFNFTGNSKDKNFLFLIIIILVLIYKHGYFILEHYGSYWPICEKKSIKNYSLWEIGLYMTFYSSNTITSSLFISYSSPSKGKMSWLRLYHSLPRLSILQVLSRSSKEFWKGRETKQLGNVSPCQSYKCIYNKWHNKYGTSLNKEVNYIQVCDRVNLEQNCGKLRRPICS